MHAMPEVFLEPCSLWFAVWSLKSAFQPTCLWMREYARVPDLSQSGCCCLLLLLSVFMARSAFQGDRKGSSSSRSAGCFTENHRESSSRDWQCGVWLDRHPGVLCEHRSFETGCRISSRYMLLSYYSSISRSCPRIPFFTELFCDFSLLPLVGMGSFQNAALEISSHIRMVWS